MKTVGYARESASYEKERQVEILREYTANGEIIMDERGTTQNLMKLLENEDRELGCIAVMGISLLGRNMEEFKTILDKLQKRGIDIMDLANKEHIETDNIGKYVQIIDRVKRNWTMEKKVYNGSAAISGARGGRPRIQEGAGSNKIYSLYLYGEITSKEAVRQLGISSSTFYRRLKEFN